MAYPNKASAILELVPNAEVIIRDDVVEWITPSVAPVTEEEIQTKYDELVAAEPLAKLRTERNKRLAETDWVVTMHKELGTNIPAAWKTYRQALRDITDDATSLDDVTWPEKP